MGKKWQLYVFLLTSILVESDCSSDIDIGLRVCANVQHDESVPHPEDCRAYFICNAEQPKINYCQANLHYDASLKVCNWPNQANCAHEVLPPQPVNHVPQPVKPVNHVPQPVKPVNHVPQPVKPVMPTVQPQWINNNLEAIIERQISIGNENSVGSVRTNAPYVQTNPPYIRTNPPYIRTNLPYIQTNRPYIQTNPPHIQTNRPYIQTNPPYIRTRPTTRKTQPTTTKLYIRTPSEEDIKFASFVPKCEPVKVEFIRHPNNCNQYFVCKQGKAELRKCPANLWWDQTAEWCSLPLLSDCRIHVNSSQS